MKKEGICNECSGEIIRTTGGFYVCKECGLAHDIVIDDRVSPQYENENDSDEFNNIQQNIRQTVPSISTMLKTYIPRNMRKTPIARIIKKYSYATTEVIKTNYVFSKINKYCDDYNLGNFYSHCCHLFKKINSVEHFKLGELKGTLEDVSLAVVYLQSKLYGIPFFKNNQYIKFALLPKNVRLYYNKWLKKFNFKISQNGLDKWLWEILKIYIKKEDFKLRVLLQKNLLSPIFWNIIYKKFGILNSYQRKIILGSSVYILLNKFKYKKLSLRTLEKDINISDTSLENYAKKF